MVSRAAARGRRRNHRHRNRGNNGYQWHSRQRAGRRRPPRIYTRVTPLTQANQAIRKLAALAEVPDRIAGFHDLMHAIRDKVDYKVGVTETHATATEALAAGEGVCQDHAHIFIAAARSIGSRHAMCPATCFWKTNRPRKPTMPGRKSRSTLGWVGFDVSNGYVPDRALYSLDHGARFPFRCSYPGDPFRRAGARTCRSRWTWCRPRQQQQ
jgi:transglutaminase-like putative cysteine protease